MSRSGKGDKDANVRGELILDFVGGAFGHQMRFGGGCDQALRRATGIGAGKIPSIIDATAGLGRDAFLLASLGAHVTLIERSVEVHALLRDAHERASAVGAKCRETIDRMTLLHGDAKDLLPGLTAEVVLVDPMHPPRKNSALVKKEMRCLRELVGADPDAEELMMVALACAKKRVVLKWPLHGDPLPGLPKPSHQIRGKTIRYDVFMTGSW
jgi:16S rRNA (guanine1516-N2)-methyltransferase